MEDKLYRDLKKLKIDHGAAQSFRFSRKITILICLGALLGLGMALLIQNYFGTRKRVSVMTINSGAQGGQPVLMTSGGYIVAESEITVSSKVAGRIASLPVKEGDLVQQGEIIALLDNEELQVQRDEARANLEKASLNFKHKQEIYRKDVAEVQRRRELFKENLISPAELDKEEKAVVIAELELDRAQSEVEVCKKQLELTEVRAAEAIIRAPITGTVIDKSSDVGEMLFPMKTMEGKSGSAIVTLADLRVMNVEVDINEDEIKKVKIGTPAQVTPDSFPDRTYGGEVIAISPMADRQKKVVPVKVRIQSPDEYLKPDMSAKVTFREQSRGKPPDVARIAIPRTAVIERNGNTLVFIVENSQALEREVRLGAPEGGWVVVEQGLNEGEQLVVNGQAYLRSYDRVSITEGTEDSY